MAFVEPIRLAGTHVVLEPLAEGHATGLKAAAADGALWTLWYTGVPAPERTAAWIDAALEMRDKAGALPFVIREAETDAIVGSTRYCNVDSANRRLEIGHTWHAKRVQRTAVNTEAKLLLLTHAFEALACIAVEFRTHFFNFASRAAIARLGAKQDGILRSHQVMPDGSLRDTVVFSIVAAEWPAVRRNLVWRLEQPR